MRALRIVSLTLAGSALALGLSGCVVVPARPAYGYQGEAVYAPAYGAPPVAGYVWIDGFWDWRGGRRTWVDGRWAPPRGRGWRR